jgi:hypothetical protein
MAKEKSSNHLQDRGLQFLVDFPGLGFDHVFVTSDGAVFYGNAFGENLAMNHSSSLDDKTIITVRK